MFVTCGFDSAVSAMDVLIVHGIILTDVLTDGVRRCVADRARLIVNDQGTFRVYYLRRRDGETIIFRRVEWFDAIVIE